MSNALVQFINENIHTLSNPENGLEAEKLILMEKEYNDLKKTVDTETFREDEKDMLTLFENVLSDGVSATRSLEMQTDFMVYAERLVGLNASLKAGDVNNDVAVQRVMEMFNDFLDSYEKFSLKFGVEEVKKEDSFKTTKGFFEAFGLTF